MVGSASSCRNDNLNETFITLNNIFYGWGKIMQDNKKQLNEHIGLIFRYCREENQNFKGFLAKRQ